MKKLGLAIQTMTRLPLRRQFDATGQDYADSVLWFPLTSLLTGLVMLAVYSVLMWTQMAFLAAIGSVIAAYLFTGGFHLDGFADMCDAFFARQTRERTLEILKDSRMGTYGVLAIVVAVALKTILIAYLPWNGKGLLALLTCPVAGKIPMVLCAAWSRYPRKDGLGKYIVDYLKPQVAFAAVAVCGVIVLLCGGLFAGSVAVACMIGVGTGMYFLAEQKIGGATGDILGACNEAGEIIYLFVMAVMI